MNSSFLGLLIGSLRSGTRARQLSFGKLCSCSSSPSVLSGDLVCVSTALMAGMLTYFSLVTSLGKDAYLLAFFLFSLCLFHMLFSSRWVTELLYFACTPAAARATYSNTCWVLLLCGLALGRTYCYELYRSFFVLALHMFWYLSIFFIYSIRLSFVSFFSISSYIRFSRVEALLSFVVFG